LIHNQSINQPTNQPTNQPIHRPTDRLTDQSIKHYFTVHPKVAQRAGQLSLPHLGITKTEKKQN